MRPWRHLHQLGPHLFLQTRATANAYDARVTRNATAGSTYHHWEEGATCRFLLPHRDGEAWVGRRTAAGNRTQESDISRPPRGKGGLSRMSGERAQPTTRLGM